MYDIVGSPPQRCNASKYPEMLVRPLPADQLLSYTGKRHALVAGVLVLSNGALTLILMQVLSRAALLSLETSGLRVPPTVLFGLQGIRHGHLLRLTGTSCDGSTVTRQE